MPIFEEIWLGNIKLSWSSQSILFSMTKSSTIWCLIKMESVGIKVICSDFVLVWSEDPRPSFLLTLWKQFRPDSKLITQQKTKLEDKRQHSMVLVISWLSQDTKVFIQDSHMFASKFLSRLLFHSLCTIILPIDQIFNLINRSLHQQLQRLQFHLCCIL